MDLMTFLKKNSMKYTKKDSKKGLSILPVALIIINTSKCKEQDQIIHKSKGILSFIHERKALDLCTDQQSMFQIIF